MAQPDQRPSGNHPAYKVQVTTPWYRIGENLGSEGSDTASFQSFTASTGHRTNMLRPEVDRVASGGSRSTGGCGSPTSFIATTLPTVAPAA